MVTKKRGGGGGRVMVFTMVCRASNEGDPDKIHLIHRGVGEYFG